MEEYEIDLSCDLGNAVDEIGDLTKSTNDHLATMGVREEFSIRGNLVKLALTSNRKLTTEEVDKMKPLIEKSFNERLPWRFRVESFRHKSCESRCQSQSR